MAHSICTDSQYEPSEIDPQGIRANVELNLKLNENVYRSSLGRLVQ